MTDSIYHNHVYLDTNIYSKLCKNPDLPPKMSQYLLEKNMSAAVSDINIAELHDAYRLHETLAKVLLVIPSMLVDPWIELIQSELKSYPESLIAVLGRPINELLWQEDPVTSIVSQLRSRQLANARSNLKSDAEQMTLRLMENKKNFPPTKSGKYSVSQAKEFEWMLVIQLLSMVDLNFLRKYQTEIDTNLFKSIRLYALVIFFKYYLGNREPKSSSDFGDLFHTFYIPYCKVAILEKDLCNVLNQIKKHSDVLEDTEVRNIRIFDEFLQ